MKLALVNPNTSVQTTAMMVEVAASACGPDLEVQGFTAPFGADLITTCAALDRSASAVLSLGPALSGADAVIVAAFGDPGLSELRAALSVPVTGIAEAGMAEATEADHRFAVVTTTPDLTTRIAETAARYGHGGFAGTWTTEGDPAALTADEAALRAALSRAIDAAVREGRAGAVVIGGGPLAIAARALAAAAPVPLIEPLPAAVRMTIERLKA